MSAIVDQLKTDLADELLAQLREGGGKVAVFGSVEAERLTAAISRVGTLLASAQIDAGEAELLLRVQKDASETVLCSLLELSRRESAAIVASVLIRAMQLVDATLAGVIRAAVSGA